jgi:hypothetical protein
MLRALRRSRLLLLTLLVLSPGVGGLATPLLHPCPVDAPWMQQDAGSEHAHHGDAAGGPESGHHGAHCECPGACSAPTVAAPPAPPATLAVQAESAAPAGRRHPADLRFSASQLRLPPANGPPTA